mgnify:CR=1 FL=1
MGYYDEAQIAIARGRAKAKNCLHAPGRWTKTGYANLRIAKFRSGHKIVKQVGIECLKCGASWRFANVELMGRDEWL